MQYEKFRIAKDFEALERGERAAFVAEYKKRRSELLDMAFSVKDDGSRKIFLKTLFEFNEWVSESLKKQTFLDDEDERDLSFLIDPEASELSTMDMLMLSSRVFRDRIRDVLTGEIDLEALGVQAEELEGEILQAGEGNFKESGEGESESTFEVKRADKFLQLMEILRLKGIDAKEVIVRRGKVAKKSARRLSYYIVEIPKLNKQVLICDEIGETTFVVHGILPKEDFLLTRKPDLIKKHSDKVISVDYRSYDFWSSALKKELFERVNPPTTKAEIANADEMRKAVLEVCDSKKWLEMGDREKSEFRAGGRKLSEIAKFFDVKAANVKNELPFLELGAKIFGEDDENIGPALKKSRFNMTMREKLKEDPTLWAEEIRKLHNPEEWAKMRVEEREKLDIFGRKLNRVARIFGVEGNPVQVNTVHFELGLAIFGENEMLRTKLEEVRALNNMGKKHDRRKD